ncbi:helix-turn-helix domain-containing protein [Streptomyces sp. NPDC021020]|uniref:helix-turn-helix domain-containing protein n=1 Tax=Streptomyces sp. NPDC021020 TaxID=3365109 RepID=UPI00378730DC
MEPDLPLGQRIREHRERQGRSQAVVAGLCRISEDYLSRIERGKKTPTLPVLLSIARELRVPVAVLLGEPSDPRPRADAACADRRVASALLGHVEDPGRPPCSPAALRTAVERVWRTWETHPERFSAAADALPGLIQDVNAALHRHRSDADAAARREIQRCAADMYFMLRSYCRRTGRADLSMMVADRGLRAAEEADDPIRIAAARWNLGHILLGTDEPEAATDVALLAAEELGPNPQGEAAAMAGALQLVAVVAEGRRKRYWPARERLTKSATPLAASVGDGNVHHTVFGPTNVQLHAVSLDTEAGNSRAALALADQIDTSRLPLERRFTFQLEVARCWDLLREDAAVLVHLSDLAAVAPEDFARNPMAIQMVTDLRKRVRPTYRKQVVGLAERVGIR